MKRQYPYQAWVLQPSFKPKAITLVKPAYDYSPSLSNFDEAQGGKVYRIDILHPTLADAIADGRAQVLRMQTDIEKRQETMAKRVEALNKAEATAQKGPAA